MNAQDIKSMHIERYTSLETAQTVAYARCIKPQSIILGDDARYWVVSRRDGARLVEAGYEYAE